MVKQKRNLDEQVITFLMKQKGSVFKQRRIAKALGISAAKYPAFKDLLRELSESGKIERCQKNCYQIPDTGKQLSGMISFSSRGFAFVHTESDEEIFVGSYDTFTAFHGDKVLVEKFRKQSGKRPEGKVVEILERSKKPVFGTLKRSQQQWVVIPEMPAPPVSIVIKNEVEGIASGQMVELHHLEWDNVRYSPHAEIKQILGIPENPMDDIPIILKMFHITPEFPGRVIKELKKISEKIPEDEINRRLDLRESEIITIDPETAKDFDDAVSLERLQGGFWKLGVHIADVNYYVNPGTNLDKEARNRGTSIYLGNTVVPMLPERISNELCSLEPNKDKLTLSVFMHIDKNGIIQNFEITPSVISSVKRFSYEEVQSILDKDSGSHWETLENMRKLSKILNKSRSTAGSIDFDIPEPIFKIGDDGVPVEIKPSERLDSHRLIEEFMLLANKTVAEWIAVQRKREKLPFIYRIHPAPSEEAIDNLYDLLKRLGLDFHRPDPVTPNDIRRILMEIESMPFKHFIEQIALRSMSKAVYSAKPLSHFGLAFRHYTHFTSPIRRYPDLIVHRLIKLYLDSVSDGDKSYFRRSLPRTAELSSENEIRAMELERKFIKIKQIRFLANKIGEWYSGIITGVMEFGFFVEISDYLIEGLVHVRTLNDDYYVYDEQNHTLKGRKYGRSFRLGDRVMVKIAEVSVKERLVDFEWGE